MRNHFVYLNGRVLPAEQACISPFDIGLLRGYAVFDLLRTVGGRPFLLAEHLERLHASAACLGLAVPVSDSEIERAVDELLERNAHADEATVRFVLTGGESSDGMSFDAETPTFLILTHDLHEPPASWYDRGGRLVTREHKRELCEAKTTNYLTMLKHRFARDEAGAVDLLYYEGDQVTEAASASFYIVKDGIVRGPREDVLPGTISAFVFALPENSHPVQLGELCLEDVFEADEAFMTSTTRGVLPIVQIDDRKVGSGEIGPVTRDLMRLFRQAAFGEDA